MDFRHYLDEIARLRPKGAPENLVVLPRVDSTNRVARAVADEYQVEEQPLQPLLILALEQTGGRGRQGRVWTSPAGKGVYATRVVSVEEAPRLQSLPLLVGVGLCRALAPYLPSPCCLKWPNDLVVEVEGRRRKLGGVLIESWVGAGGEAAACIGFGVNLSHAAEDLPAGGISLRDLGAEDLDLPHLAWSLTLGLEGELRWLEEEGGEIAERYRALSVHRTGEPLACQVGEEEVAGTFQGFDEAGRLRLATGSGERLLAAGEIIER